MSHDVFISHSSGDKSMAVQVCARMENAGLSCWIAPRDVRPGYSYPGEITRAIQNSKVFILILSGKANSSHHVIREVDIAANSRLNIIQLRIEDVIASDDLAYYLSLPHRIDAIDGEQSIHLDRLEKAVFGLLGIELEQIRDDTRIGQNEAAAKAAEEDKKEVEENAQREANSARIAEKERRAKAELKRQQLEAEQKLLREQEEPAEVARKAKEKRLLKEKEAEALRTADEKCKAEEEAERLALLAEEKIRTKDEKERNCLEQEKLTKEDIERAAATERKQRLRDRIQQDARKAARELEERYQADLKKPGK